MEPDDIQLLTTTWDDVYIPELVEGALSTAANYADWELEVHIAAQAVYASHFLNLN